MLSDVDWADVMLRRLDEALLPLLLQTAVADADPDEVMPPVPGPAGWTVASQEAFVAFHRSRWASGDEAVPETTYAVLVSGRVAGAARLAARESENDLEVGLWLGRSYRGRGVGFAVLGHVVTEARAR
jgi:RimJ/RimL family protein N-acetyltransferase